MVQITTTGTLIIDESAGNTENDTNLQNADPTLAISSDFYNYLNTNTLLAGIIEEAKGLSITVDPEGSAISALGFTKADGTPFSTTVGTPVVDTISGLPVKTIGGETVSLFATSDPDIIVAKDASGDLVAIFYLNDAANNLSASVEMVSYQALEHHDATKGGGESAGDQDLLDWGNQLSVSAQGSLEFNFNNLDSGQFTWVAVGTDDAGMIVTGSRLNIAADGTRGGSGKTASDSMNTSQGGDGATIGVDNQMFTPGDSAIFTLVKGFEELPDTISGDATGQDIDQILHNGYLDTNSAELFISQRQGNDKLDLTMSIFEAGANGQDEDADGSGGPYAPVGAVITGSGKNQQVQRSSSFTDDTQIAIDSVEVKQGATVVGIWTTDAARAAQSTSDNIYLSGAAIVGGPFATIKVTIDGNDAFIENVDAGYSIKIVADNNDTFNRIELGSVVGNFDIGKFFIEQGVGDTEVIGDNIQTDDDRPALDDDNFTGHVDEDELTGASTGITDSDLELTSFTYTHANLLTVLSSGVDSPVHFSLDTAIAGGDVTDTSGVTIKSKGVDVVWVDNNGVLEGWTDEGAASRKVFTLQHNLNDDPGDTADDGDPTDDTFVFTLFDQIDHADGSGDEAELNINLTPAFNAVDDDGDPVLNMDTSTAIRAGVENDVPAQSAATASARVEEDELSSAAPGAGQPPADGSDGITDDDGFTDEATILYSDLDPVVTSGADEPEAFALNLAVSGAVLDVDGNAITSKGEALTWSVSGGVVQAVAPGGRIVFTVTHNANGAGATDDSFTIDLRDQIDHPDGSGDGGVETVNLTPAFVAEDYDGDSITLTGSAIQLVVENDVPAAKPNVTATEEVHEDALTGGNTPDAGDSETKVVTATYTTAEIIALAVNGADEDLTASLNTAAGGSSGAIIGTNVVTTGGANVTSGGENVMWAAGDTAGSLKGIITVAGVDTTIFTLTPAATPGDFDFTLVDQVDHGGGEDDLELLPLDLTSAFRVLDFDKDPVALNPNSVVLNVENDLPVFSAQIPSRTLDWIDENSITGTLHGKPGTDESAGYIIDKYTDLAGYDETLSGDGKTLTYSKGGVTFFTLVLDDAANGGAGGYTFTVHEQPPNVPLELDFEDLDSGQNLFGTIAFDKTVVDDAGTLLDLSDDFLPGGGLLTFPSNADINDGEGGKPAESTDGTMTSDSGTTNTSKGGGPVTIGNENQAFDHNDEGAWFAYVDNPQADAVSGVGLDPNRADDADNIQFDGMVEVRKASVELVQASGNGGSRPGPALTVTAWDLNPGTVNDSSESRAFLLDPTATGVQSNIIGIKIYDANGVLIEYRTNTEAGASNTGVLQDIAGADDSAVVITFVRDDNSDPLNPIYSAQVSNLKANYTIEWETEEVHDAALVQNVSGSYDIGGFNILQGQDSLDVDLEFSVAIEDKDGDLTHFDGTSDVFDDFKIKVDGTGVNDDPSNVAPTGFSTSYDSAADFANFSATIDHLTF